MSCTPGTRPPRASGDEPAIWATANKDAKSAPRERG